MSESKSCGVEQVKVMIGDTVLSPPYLPVAGVTVGEFAGPAREPAPEEDATLRFNVHGGLDDVTLHFMALMRRTSTGIDCAVATITGTVRPSLRRRCSGLAPPSRGGAGTPKGYGEQGE